LGYSINKTYKPTNLSCEYGSCPTLEGLCNDVLQLIVPPPRVTTTQDEDNKNNRDTRSLLGAVSHRLRQWSMLSVSIIQNRTSLERSWSIGGAVSRLLKHAVRQKSLAILEWVEQNAMPGRVSESWLAEHVVARPGNRESPEAAVFWWFACHLRTRMAFVCPRHSQLSDEQTLTSNFMDYKDDKSFFAAAHDLWYGKT